jgi:hypothetical protein
MRRLAGAGGVGFMALALLAFPATTLARGGGGDDIRKAGVCSGSTTSKIKVKHRDGGTELEFEVDSNVNGQTWNVSLKRNGTTFWSGQRVTQAPSGSFSVERRTTDPAGTDTFKGRAKNPNTGEVCTASVSI